MKTMSAILCLIMLVGCYTRRTARLYDLNTGSVLYIDYVDDNSGAGQVEIELPSGEILRGEFTYVQDTTTNWGGIFGSIGGTSTTYPTLQTTQSRRTGSALSLGVSQGSKNQGVAVMVGNQGTVIRCEFLSDGNTGHGNGACQDNQGNVYQLIF